MGVNLNSNNKFASSSNNNLNLNTSKSQQKKVAKNTAKVVDTKISNAAKESNTLKTGTSTSSVGSKFDSNNIKTDDSAVMKFVNQQNSTSNASGKKKAPCSGGGGDDYGDGTGGSDGYGWGGTPDFPGSGGYDPLRDNSLSSNITNPGNSIGSASLTSIPIYGTISSIANFFGTNVPGIKKPDGRSGKVMTNMDVTLTRLTMTDPSSGYSNTSYGIGLTINFNEISLNNKLSGYGSNNSNNNGNNSTLNSNYNAIGSLSGNAQQTTKASKKASK